MDTQEKKIELAQSAMSYGFGGSGMVLGFLVDAANYAQAGAIILGFVIVFIRAVHDAVNLYRMIKRGKE